MPPTSPWQGSPPCTRPSTSTTTSAPRSTTGRRSRSSRAWWATGVPHEAGQRPGSSRARAGRRDRRRRDRVRWTLRPVARLRLRRLGGLHRLRPDRDGRHGAAGRGRPRLPGAGAPAGVRHRPQLPQPRRGVRHGPARGAGHVHQVPGQPRSARSTTSRSWASSVDWEVELVAVIGTRADRVAEADGWSHVAGLTIGQDISDRALQFAAGAQFSLGKSRRGYGPMGPWVVTLDEVPDPDDLALGCSVDGEVDAGLPHERSRVRRPPAHRGALRRCSRSSPAT